jgi:hypothetical protein
MWRIWERRKMHTGFWSGNLKEGDLGVDGRVVIRWILKIWVRKVLIGLIWLWTGASGGLL